MNQSDQDIRSRLLLARLPALPQILIKLLELCQADGAGMLEMAKLIANDVGLTVKILNIASGAAYSKAGKRASLMQALSTLGMDMIKTMVINESILNTSNAFPHLSDIDLRMFWKHGLTTAIISRELAKLMGYPHVEEAYLAGLIHDVGRLALVSAAPQEYSATFYLDDDEGLGAIEYRALRITHAEAGAWMIEHWKLDSFMSDAVLYHHESEGRIEDAHTLIRIVHLAHKLANHDPQIPLAEDAGYLCKISYESLLATQQSAESQVLKAAAILGMDLSGLQDWTPPECAAPAKVSVIQSRMNDEVRHMTLAAEVGQTYARQTDDTQMLSAIRQSAHLLFDLQDSIILVMSGDGQSLVCVSVGEQRQRLAEYFISLAKGGSVAQSALQNRVVFLQRHGMLMDIAHEQLFRIFNVDALVCIPLSVGSERLGLLIAGVPTMLLADLQPRERFLQSFGVKAAAALKVAARDRGEIDRRITLVREEHNASSRRVLHEVNNPLAIIKNYLGVLNDKLARQEPVGEAISILNEEIDRVGNMLHEFVGAASNVKPPQVDINRIASNLIRMLRDSKFLPPGVEVVERLSDQECLIDGPADTVKQVLINLIKNSIEAMPKGGRIEIISGGRVRRSDAAHFHLCVKDNGPGIPADQLGQIFSPLKSTKAGANRGIGLSIVHGLVKNLDGQIECVSSSGGTEFNMYLPAFGVQKSVVPTPYELDLL